MIPGTECQVVRPKWGSRSSSITISPLNSHSRAPCPTSREASCTRATSSLTGPHHPAHFWNLCPLSQPGPGMPSFPSPSSPSRDLGRADLYLEAKLPSAKPSRSLQPTGGGAEGRVPMPTRDRGHRARRGGGPHPRYHAAAAEPGQGPNRTRRDRPPLLPAAAVAGRVRLPPGAAASEPRPRSPGGPELGTVTLPAAAAAARGPPRPGLQSRGGSLPAQRFPSAADLAAPAPGAGERSRGVGLGGTSARATGSPEHRESGEAGRHPTPCPTSDGCKTPKPSRPHRLPAAGPEVAGRGLRCDRSGRFKKKKKEKEIQSCGELYWQLQAQTAARVGPTGRPSLIGGGHDLGAGQGRAKTFSDWSWCPCLRPSVRPAAFRLVSIHLAARGPGSAGAVPAGGAAFLCLAPGPTANDPSCLRPALGLWCRLQITPRGCWAERHSS